MEKISEIIGKIGAFWDFSYFDLSNLSILVRKDACLLSDEEKEVNAHISCASGIWGPSKSTRFFGLEGFFLIRYVYSEFEQKKHDKKKTYHLVV